MDFSKILEDWDRETARAAGKKACKQALNGASKPAPLAKSEPVAPSKEVKAPDHWYDHIDIAKESRSGAPKAGGGSSKGSGASAKSVDPMTAWMRIHGVSDKDSELERTESPQLITGHEASERRRRLHEMRPDAVVDLHGLTRDEAWERLSSFFAAAQRQGAEKVLIVHGKGNHSEGEAVLKKATRDFLESCPFAGESGHADSRLGGAGATWVLLKEISARGR